MSQKFRILVPINHDWNFTGADKRLIMISQMLRNEGFETHLLASQIKTECKKYFAEGCIVHESSPPYRGKLGALIFLIKGGITLHKKLKFNVVLINDPPVTVEVLAGFLLSRILKLPWIIVIHGHSELNVIPPNFDYFLAKRRRGLSRLFAPFSYLLGNILRKYIAKQADSFISVSPRLKWETAESLRVNPNKIFICYTGLDLQEISHVHASSKKSDVAFLGRLEFEKGIDILVAAWKFVHRKNPDLKLIIIGEGSLREAIKRDVELLENTVIMTGFVPSPNCYSLLKKSRILVLPLRRGGLGQAALVGMACGLPVILPDTPEHRKMFGSTAIYAKLEPEDLASTIISTLANELSCKSLIKSSYEFVKNFDWTECAKKEKEVYIQLITKVRSAS